MVGERAFGVELALDQLDVVDELIARAGERGELLAQVGDLEGEVAGLCRPAGAGRG